MKCLANSYLENILDQAAIFLLLEENQSLAQLPWVTQLNITCLIALIGCKYIQLPSAASWTALFDIHVLYQYLQEWGLHPVTMRSFPLGDWTRWMLRLLILEMYHED